MENCSSSNRIRIKTSVVKEEKQSLNVYPNPATTIARLRISNKLLCKSELRILDAFGKETDRYSLETGVKDLFVNISDYKRGIYYLELRSGCDQTTICKLVIMN